MGVSLFYHVMMEQQEMASSCSRGGLDWILRKLLYPKGSQAMEHASQGSGGVTIRGDI